MYEKRYKQCTAEYIIKFLILLNRVHIVVLGKNTAGCQQTFAGDNRLSPDILLVTTGCHQTKKSGDNWLSADLAYQLIL